MLGVDPVEVSGGRGEIAMWGLMAMETICVVWVVRLMEVRARGKVMQSECGAYSCNMKKRVVVVVKVDW